MAVRPSVAVLPLREFICLMLLQSSRVETSLVPGSHGIQETPGAGEEVQTFWRPDIRERG